MRGWNKTLSEVNQQQSEFHRFCSGSSVHAIRLRLQPIVCSVYMRMAYTSTGNPSSLFD